ncbi:hypothetical protein CTT30_16475 [Vibrio coralliilyticus]|uniref:ATP-binding protein n=2 Tax=Vibrionaceae TaxID=641 RepID=UPI0020761C4D|nr:ATP-binding protein [Vibrio sp. SCSIO 43145]USD47935.1 response regulator [Vibrio sp. SCSIO 43145]USD97661.1 hypothetical protein CTT30_16475 [Vibrio coralliilyticus]
MLDLASKDTHMVYYYQYVTNVVDGDGMAIKRRLAKWFFFLVFALLGALAIYYFVTKNTEKSLSQVKDALQVEAMTKADYFREHIERNIAAAKFLHSTPPISGITRALSNDGLDVADGTTLEQWKARLSIIFKGMIENNPDVMQLSVIVADESGQEFIRVDRIQGKVLILPDNQLQSKSKESYYGALKTLNFNEIYITPINLNREHGRVAFPFQPTYRIFMPIFYESGKRFGALKINIDASSLLTYLTQAHVLADDNWLVDSDGYFITAKNEKKQFTRQLEPSANIHLLYDIREVENGYFEITSKAGSGSWLATKEEVYLGNNISKQLTLYSVINQLTVQNIVQEELTELWLVVGFVLVFALVALALFYRSYQSSLQLNQMNSRSKTVIENASDAIICLDASGAITTWNRSAEKLFGQAEHYVINKPLSSIVTLSEHDLSEVLERAKNTQAIQLIEDQITTDDTVFIEVSVAPIVSDGQRRSNSLVVNIRNITGAVKAQEALENYNSELEEKVSQRTEELQAYSFQLEDAHEKALEASQAKSKFIATISHEMRTPLNGMMGMLSLIKTGGLSAVQSNYLTMAENSVNTLAVLINDILDLSKIESGKLEINHILFSPRDVLETLVQTCAVKAREKGLEVILDTVDIDYKKVFGDPNRIKQIASNLINNAIKFTNEGEVKVLVSVTQQEPSVVRLVVDVYDTGIGIAKENQHRLFQPFSQEKSEVSEQYGGTGLGLSICRQLCKLMNGEIEFESEKDKGSHFKFFVDFDESQCEQEEKALILSGQAVAIALNNESLLESVTRTVHSLGGEVLHITDTASESLKQSDRVIFDDAHPLRQEIISMVKARAKTDSPLHAIELCAHLNQASGHYPNSFRISKPSTYLDFLVAFRGEQTKDVNVEIIENEASSIDIDLSGTRVLVVDDNEINREVARGYLERVGALVFFAHDGEQCLEVVKKSFMKGVPFDCILLDCQMPVMNGYDCSRQLRYNSQTYGSGKLPIIAMTANAFSGEREKCISYGMNDFISKPVDAELLIKKVEQWVGLPDEVLSMNQAEGFSEEMVEGGEPEWDKDNALVRMRGDHELLHTIVEIFRETASEHIEALGQSIKEGNSQEIFEWSHKLKAVCGDIGADKLRELFSKIESEARKTEGMNINYISEIYKKVLYSDIRLRREIDAYLA